MLYLFLLPLPSVQRKVPWVQTVSPDLWDPPGSQGPEGISDPQATWGSKVERDPKEWLVQL